MVRSFRLRTLSATVRACVGLAGIAVVAATLAIFNGNLQAAPTGLPSGFTATPLINHSMMAPTSVRIAPDGRIFVFDLFGSIKIFNASTGFSTFGSVTVHATGDRGLLGATFDSDFANNPYVYVHYVGADDKVRIGRFNAGGNTGTNFTDIYTATEASGFQHAGGGITMGPDNCIYFGIGDSGTPTNSQDLTKIHGKLHRINRDGTVPANPFAGQAGVASTVYAYGVRNPFRLQTDKLTGTIYVGDVGFNTWEEVNIVQSGKNYGWATQEGPCTSSCPYENPVHWYPHQYGTNNTNDASITAGPIYRGTAYPASYQGKMFYSDYVQGFLRTMDPSQVSDSYTTFSTGNGSVVDMDVGPDGKLYFITITSPTLYRLDYNGDTQNTAPTAVASANVTAGNAPLDINFSSAGSADPEGQPLTYTWNFGDGTTSTQANPTKTFANEGQYTVTLQVSDGTYTVPATPITIQVGEQPTVTINSPTAATQYKGGDVINYSATAVDSHGDPITGNDLKTTVKLYHSDHNHPFFGPIDGGSGQFTIPKNGELSPEVWYRITVEATDHHGVVGSAFVDIQPYKATVTVNTSPAGLNVVLDGSNHVIPPTVQGVVGMTRQIAAPSPQMFNGVQYVFDHWSDGGAQDHTFDFPMTNTTYTAHYVPATGGGTTYQNIVANPSYETLGSNNLPASWTASKWGANDAVYSVSSDARTGVRSARMDITSYSSGEDRLYHTAVNVAPSTVHNVRYFYKSNVQTKAVADVTLTDNTHKYIWLGINQPSSGDTWREQNWTFTTPANAKHVVVSLYLVSVGYFQVDDFNLLAPTAGGGDPGPVVVAPVVTLGATQTTITAGQSTTLNWSATGTSPACTASGGWSGAQNASGSLSVSPSTTTTYTLTCTNSAGSDTKSVTITVNPVVPPTPTTGNIAPNPSFEEEDASHNTLGWRKAKWGTNDAVFSVVHGSAFDGNHHVKATVTSFASGEASWSFVPQAVTGSTVYAVDLRAKSTGPTKVLADVTLTDGTHKYFWLGTLPASTTDWKVFTKNFTTPASAVSATVGAYLTGIGSIEIDQFTVTPPASAPVITFGADPTTIIAGQSSTLSWSVAGSSSFCTASGAWNGGIASSGTTTVRPSATSTYTLMCSNSAGSDTQSVTITVNPVTPPPTGTNLIANASMEDDPAGTGIPLGWYSGGWGTNTTLYTYESTGRTGKSLKIAISDFVSGDAKWFFEPTTVTAGSSYTFKNWYKASANTEMVAEYTLSDGTKSYFWLGVLAPAADWTENVQSLTIPAGATKVTIQHVLKGNGTLQLDDYSLVLN